MMRYDMVPINLQSCSTSSWKIYFKKIINDINWHLYIRIFPLKIKTPMTFIWNSSTLLHYSEFSPPPPFSPHPTQWNALKSIQCCLTFLDWESRRLIFITNPLPLVGEPGPGATCSQGKGTLSLPQEQAAPWGQDTMSQPWPGYSCLLAQCSLLVL